MHNTSIELNKYHKRLKQEYAGMFCASAWKEFSKHIHINLLQLIWVVKWDKDMNMKECFVNTKYTMATKNICHANST